MEIARERDIPICKDKWVERDARSERETKREREGEKDRERCLLVLLLLFLRLLLLLLNPHLIYMLQFPKLFHIQQ